MFVDSNVVVHIFVCEVVALSILVREVSDLFFIPYRIITPNKKMDLIFGILISPSARL